jgi:hypothetical protein
MDILIDEAQAWLETTRANLGTDLDVELESSIATQVLARLSLSFDVSDWTTPEKTPKLVRKIIAMKYASWYYQRLYSEDSDSANDYALLLNAQAETLLDGVATGSLTLPEVTGEENQTSWTSPSFYPDNTTSPSATMGKVW